jgi:hypothetical protein
MDELRTHHHFARVSSLRGIGRDVAKVKGFNAKAAVLLTRGVGTMAAAYAFMLLALVSLPAAIRSGDPVILVSWVSQTFLQLVLLSVIMVGQGVQAAAGDARAEKNLTDTEKVLDRLDEHTQGGITTVLDAINALRSEITRGPS